MESAAVELGSQGPTFDDEIDVDSLLQGFPYDFADDLDLWLSSPSPVCSTPNSPKESEAPIAAAPLAEEIERFLMDDDDPGEAQVEDDGTCVDEFLSGVLVDGSGVGSGSGSGKSEVASPESGGSAVAEVVTDGVVAIDGEDKDDDDDDDSDEHVSKKRRRQMRNRESAMQSRERKKLYVKDLEMKSKYLESECRRLDYALRCCMAENAALQRLQKNGAHMARQESAVLFMESLLLGSLFWLVSIVYLFLVPSLQNLNQKDASRLGRGLALEDAWSKTILIKKPRPDFGLDMVIMRRRCRGLRTRMKAFLFPLHCLSA